MNKNYIEVEGYPGLVRDPETNAILNVDFKAIELARARKRAKIEQKQKEQALDDRLTSIEEALKTLIQNL